MNHSAVSEEDIIRLLDQMTTSDISRMKVELSESLSEGTSQKQYHHGRCDVGSPFATGKLYCAPED